MTHQERIGRPELGTKELAALLLMPPLPNPALRTLGYHCAHHRPAQFRASCNNSPYHRLRKQHSSAMKRESYYRKLATTPIRVRSVDRLCHSFHKTTFPSCGN